MMAEQSIMSELKTKFEHPAQHIERVRGTSSMLVQRLVRTHVSTFESIFPDAPEPDKEFIVAAFQYLTINGLLPDDYDLDEFLRDVRLFQQHITREDKKRTILDVLDTMVKVLVDAIIASFGVLATIIDEKSSKTPDYVVRAVVLYKYYIEAAESIGHQIAPDLEQVNVRFVAAVLLHGLNMMYRIKRRQVPCWSISDLFDMVAEKYPLEHGTDLLWDILKIMILRPNYDSIVELGQKTITERLAVLERERKAGHVATRVVRQTKDESGISMVGESILYDLFRRNGELSGDREQKLERMLDIGLRQAANKKYGKQDISDSDLLVDLAIDMFTKLIYAFEMLAVAVIPPPMRKGFLQDPKEFVREHRSMIPIYVKKKLNAILIGRLNTTTIARAIVRLVKTASMVHSEQ